MTVDIKQQLESRYAWSPFEGKAGSNRPTSWKRPMINCEHLFEIFRDSMGTSVSIHNLVFIELDEPLTKKAFHVRMLNAWMNVRATTPFVAARIEKGSEPNGLPNLVVDEMDIQAEQTWALQTLDLEESEDKVITLDSLKKMMDAPAIPSAEGYNAIIRCIVPKNQKKFTTAALGVWMSHSMFDGVSARIVLSDMRKYLARPELVLGQPLPAGLPGLTTSLMDDKWGPPSMTMSEEHIGKLTKAANNLVHHPPPRDPNLPDKTRVLQTWEKFSREETKEITSHCRKYGLTATPFILSALLVRRIIDRIDTWPIPKEAIYTQVIPIDPRSVLTDKRAVGMCSVYDFLIVPVGEIFKGRSKEEIEKDIVEVIHQVSLKANETFAQDRSEKGRVDFLKYNEANLGPMLSAIATGDANPSNNVMNLYPDCVVGEPSLEMNIIPTADGIGSKVTDIFMHCKAEIDTTFSRTWVFQGQTSISINASEGFMSEKEAERVVKAWRKDILNVCRKDEVDWDDDSFKFSQLGCMPDSFQKIAL